MVPAIVSWVRNGFRNHPQNDPFLRVRRRRASDSSRGNFGAMPHATGMLHGDLRVLPCCIQVNITQATSNLVLTNLESLDPLFGFQIAMRLNGETPSMLDIKPKNDVHHAAANDET